MSAGQLQILRPRPEQDAGDLARPFFPVELEFHAVVIEARPVAGVEGAAAAVFGRAVEGVHQLAVQRPDADALGLEVRLGHPQMVVGVDGQAVGVVHVVGVVRPGLRGAGAADRTKEFALRIEHFHLMAVAAVADVDVASGVQGELLRIFQSLRHDHFRRGQRGFRPHFGQRIAQKTFAGQGQQSPPAVERQAAWVVERRRDKHLSRPRVHEQELILLRKAARQQAVAHGQPGERRRLLAALKLVRRHRLIAGSWSGR